uniref:hypothetical protein n=1 Tax=Ningiella ruwaisensis TaxID=2364274 RepID=UPI00109F9CC1|nr:hypothetical protein [Ningiella ruwaisensis]
MTTSAFTAADNRLAAIYSSREALVSAKQKLISKLAIKQQSIEVIEPKDDAKSYKLEGESKPIGMKMLWVHLVYGAVGIAVGLMVGWLLVNYGPEFTQLNPTFTYIAMLSPGLFIGLFLSGLVSLKPQHDKLNQSVVKASKEDEWTLLIKLDECECDRGDVEDVINGTETKKII